LAPEAPSLLVEAAPSGWQVASTYFWLGMEHILLGFDHLLFVLGLLLIVDRRWVLVKTITAFTVAHSLTLALSVLAVVHVPQAPLNTAIAMSILFLGPEIVRKWRGQTSLTIRHPWVVAFVFGLLHGIGFASGLSVTGLPQSEIPSALLFFNVGVEAGQMFFVLVAVTLGMSVRTLELDRTPWVTRVPAYVVGTLGAFWTIQCLYALAGTLVTRT
jgi:hydrogenase/urease accessory protein HupE